ncbi:hypothetical protein Esti_006592 [Eimeria stiedai]
MNKVGRGPPPAKPPPLAHTRHLVKGALPEGLLLPLVTYLSRAWSCCGIVGLLVLLPLVLRPLNISFWLPLFWGTSWALCLRLSCSSSGKGPPSSVSLRRRGALSAPSYVVGIFLSPLFLASCMTSATQGPPAVPNPFSDLLQALPVALAVSGAQASLLRFTASSLPLLLVSGATWLVYPFLGAPLEGPFFSWVGLGALTLNLLLMSCWHKEGRSDFSFSEASSLSQLFTAATLCFVAAPTGLVEAPLGTPPFYSPGGPHEPTLRGDVLAFLHRMFLILLLFCLGSLGALFLPKGASRASYLRISAGAFVTTTTGYLLLGPPPDAGKLGGSGGFGGPLMWWLLSFVVHNETHARLMLLLLTTSALGLLVAFLLASKGPQGGPCRAVAQTLEDQKGESKATPDAEPWLSSLRKLFHFLLVANLLLVVFSGFFSLLLLVVSGLLWLVTAAELLRVSRLSLAFSELIELGYAKFTDFRDARGLVLSHIYLVLGVAAPLLAFAAFRGAPGGPPCLLGIILVGCGDSMAALVGARCSTPVLPFTSRKTVGGLIAFVVSSLAFGFCLFPQVFPGQQVHASAFVAAALASGVFEAYTHDIDNFQISMLGFAYYQWWAAAFPHPSQVVLKILILGNVGNMEGRLQKWKDQF